MMFIMVISGAMMVLLNANDSRCNNLCVMRIQSLSCDIPGLTVPLASMLLDNISSFNDPRNISLLEIMLGFSSFAGFKWCAFLCRCDIAVLSVLC